MNPDVYKGPWGGANCRDSVAQVSQVHPTRHISVPGCYISDISDILFVQFLYPLFVFVLIDGQDV